MIEHRLISSQAVLIFMEILRGTWIMRSTVYPHL